MSDLEIDYNDFELISKDGTHIKVSSIQREFDEREKNTPDGVVGSIKEVNPTKIKSSKTESLALIYDLNISPEDRSLLLVKKYDYKLQYNSKDSKEPLVISLRHDDWQKEK